MPCVTLGTPSATYGVARWTGSLDQAEQRLDTGRAFFNRALDLLDNPQAMYRRGNETVKTILNKAFFTKLYVDGHKVTDHELEEPFGLLSDAYQLYQDQRQQPAGIPDLPPSACPSDAQSRRTRTVRRL